MRPPIVDDLLERPEMPPPPAPRIAGIVPLAPAVREKPLDVLALVRELTLTPLRPPVRTPPPPWSCRRMSALRLSISPRSSWN